MARHADIVYSSIRSTDLNFRLPRWTMTLVARFLPHGIKRGRSDRSRIRRIPRYIRDPSREKGENIQHTRGRDFFFRQRREKERRKSLASIAAEEHTPRREGERCESRRWRREDGVRLGLSPTRSSRRLSKRPRAVWPLVARAHVLACTLGIGGGTGRGGLSLSLSFARLVQNRYLRLDRLGVSPTSLVVAHSRRTRGRKTRRVSPRDSSPRDPRRPRCPSTRRSGRRLRAKR